MAMRFSQHIFYSDQFGYRKHGRAKRTQMSTLDTDSINCIMIILLTKVILSETINRHDYPIEVTPDLEVYLRFGPGRPMGQSPICKHTPKINQSFKLLRGWSSLNKAQEKITSSWVLILYSIIFRTKITQVHP